MITSLFCTKCETQLSVDCFYASYVGPRTKRGVCKQCASKRSREWKLANKEHDAEWRRTSEKYKNCRSVWGKKNREKLNNAANEWRDKNRTKHNERRRAYNAEKKDKIKAQKHAYYLRHKDKIAAKNRERTIGKTFRSPAWADKEALRAVYREARRLRKEGRDVHVDHVIPLNGKNVSGLHVHQNLEIIPAADNLRKLNKFMEAAY